MSDQGTPHRCRVPLLTTLATACVCVAAASAAPPAIVGSRQVVPGAQSRLSWPARGQAAVAVAGVGLIGASPGERSVPIASLTKMMTALVVVTDHPLAPGDTGPTIPIGAQDVEEWHSELKAGDSVLEVRAGEQLTEFQALEALLVPSADNIADRLALWDAGSLAAFVAKMNARARQDGLGQTHYVDPSGLDPRSASTAADQAYLASQLMAIPVIRTIVRRRRINLPVVGIIPNTNPALRVDGIVGVKTGFTSHAHRCLVTAAYRLHHAALVVSVALGQPAPLAAARLDESLLRAATRELELRRLAVATAPVQQAIRLASVVVGLTPPARALRVVAWPGLMLTVRVVPTVQEPRRSRSMDGTRFGELTVALPWGTLGPALVRLAPANPSIGTAAAG